MSPEQVEGKRVSVQSDIFSLGTILYWLSTGQLPFQGSNTPAVLKAIAEVRYPDPREVQAGVPDGLAQVIARCLKEKPEERFPEVSSLENELLKFLTRSGIESPRNQPHEFFLSPHIYQKRLKKSLILHFLAQGKKSLAKKEFGSSLSAFERVLSLDPSNPEALRLVTASRTEKRRWTAAAAVLVLGLGAGAIMYILRTGPRGGNSVEPTRIETTISEKADVSQAPARQQSGKQTNTRTEAHVAPQVRNGSLRLTTLPWAQVFVDGQYMGDTPFVKNIDLVEGSHEIRLENPYCLPYRETIHILPEKTLDKRVRLTSREQREE